MAGAAPRIPEQPPAPVLRLLPLSLLALVVGVVAGLGAVVFRGLIGLVHNLLFLGRFSFLYDARLFTPAAPWGALVILVPVLGALGVTWLVSNFAPEAKGHGVPEVMDAIYYERGIIRPVVAVIKSIASALAIGSGAAVGREGPIIQIGAAMGSTLGQIIRMRPGQRITLVAAGAGAGIAATFNTPIGGVLFATELMLPEVSVNTFLPVAVATGTATFLGRLFFGSQPAFSVPAHLAPIPDVPSSAATLALYALLGAVMGIAAAGFIHGLQWAEDAYARIPGNYLRHGTGMLLVGILMYALWRTAGHYYVEGVGYSTIQAALHGQITGIGFLLVLYAGKLFATCTSLGSGSSGGIFSPALFMGAAIGAAFAAALLWLFPHAPVSLPAFAMVGMGAMVAGATGAAMTAVTMIFEMTRDYFIVLPMILAVATAYAVRRSFSPESIYTMKIARRGHPVPKALQANLFLVRSAAEIMDRDVLVLDGTTSFADLLSRAAVSTGLQHIVVTEEGRVVGWLRVDTSLRRTVGVGAAHATLGELAHRTFVTVRPTDAVFSVITAMSAAFAAAAIVLGDAKGSSPEPPVLGVITREHVAEAVAGTVQIYPA
ncbi:MAG TPA: chloride channel protein [Acetobacteraceae bacterium]|nr:chloride channel protein [Acetobacteraceae bacterium]